MAAYKYNHAIGKTQSGGVQLGLLRDLYQSPVGNKEPVDPAARHEKQIIHGSMLTMDYRLKAGIPSSIRGSTTSGITTILTS